MEKREYSPAFHRSRKRAGRILRMADAVGYAAGVAAFAKLLGFLAWPWWLVALPAIASIAVKMAVGAYAGAFVVSPEIKRWEREREAEKSEGNTEED